jgi:hypothetical protein
MKATINPTYRKLYSIRLGNEPLQENKLHAGLITVSVDIDRTFTIEGTYNAKNGLLSGLKALYKNKFISDDALNVEYEISSLNEIVITSSRPTVSVNNEVEHLEHTNPVLLQSVFQKRQLRHLHIEPFRAENLKNWTPKTESDLYMIFGVVESYTGYKYCCGTNADLLKQLGYTYDENNAKPDAILIDTATSEYLIAEFKVKSSMFKSNHKPEEIDILVVWANDETDGTKLPKTRDVLVLEEIVRLAAIDTINGTI